jgi:hypothetical protein
VACAQALSCIQVLAATLWRAEGGNMPRCCVFKFGDTTLGIIKGAHPDMSREHMFADCASLGAVVEAAADHATDKIGRSSAHMVCKLWSDFEVTSEKGGPAYGSRSTHTIKPSLECLMQSAATRKTLTGLFPKTHVGTNRRTYGYMICPDEVALAAHARAFELICPGGATERDA